MKSTHRQYLFGLVFLGVAAFQIYAEDLLEFLLYVIVGLAFIVNALTQEPRLVAYKVCLVIGSWILIILSGITFLYLLQYKWF
jgi:hypothetical protein